MAQQPSDESIDFLLSLVPEISRQEAIARLKGNNHNVEQAVNEWFDAGQDGRDKYRWDEAQFNSERDGSSSNHGISFDIQGPDDPGPYGRFDGALSRPPSRSNNRSPLSNVIGMTADHAAADPMDSVDQQDRDLQQALAASRADAGLPPQETGLTGDTDTVYFGPAERSQYESGQWEMVPMERSSAQEIILDPEPAERKRDPDVPAFLKPSTGNNRLGALMTIYHAIPLVREIFLDRIDVLQNYGHDREWWTGKAIELPAFIGEDQPMDHLVNREIQRLMAFLDKTDRSYGSVEALANSQDVKESQGIHGTVENAVWDAWRKIFESQPAVVIKLFSQGVANEAAEEHNVNHEFAMLELSLPSKGSIKENLYDIADDALWPSLGPVVLAESSYLSHVADVIAFKVEGSDSHNEIDIPAIWYPDRYLKQGREAALEMRLAKMEVDDRLRSISNTEDKLTMRQMRNGKIVKVQDLLKASLRHDEAEIGEEGKPLDDEDVDMVASQRSGKGGNLSVQLQKIFASIDKKLLALNEEKEKAKETMRELSKLYTEPLDIPSVPALHKYTLRGVSTTKSTMYLCRRAEPCLIDMDLDDDGLKTMEDQWWKINYAPSGSNPITVEKTTEEKVLAAAKSESKKTILVYASEKAMNWERKALPTPLENFVRFDNAAFRTEFSNDVEDTATQATVSSPGKRKFADQSEGSHVSSMPWRESNVRITERELKSSDESGSSGGASAGASGWEREPQRASKHMLKVVNGDPEDVVDGVDPSLLMNNGSAYIGNQEMKERGSGMIPILSGMQTSKAPATIDSMDLDSVMEDGIRAEESNAVKHVEFRD